MPILGTRCAGSLRARPETMAGRALAIALLLGFGALPGSADRAAAATTEIGAVAEIRSGELPAPISEGGYAVQISEASGTYAVPPGYGRITAWSHSAGTLAGEVTFKVYRPTGGLREFIVVGSDTRVVSAGAVHTFPVQIPVQAGDRIGLASDQVQLAYETFNVGDRIGFFGDNLPLAAIDTTDGEPFPEFKLDVSATVQTPPDQPGAVTNPPAAAVPYPLPAPRLQRLSVAPSTFAAARNGATTRRTPRRGIGTKVSYRVDIASSLRFTVQRVLVGRRTSRSRAARCAASTPARRRFSACMRYVTVRGGFSQTARPGANSFYFMGRLNGRRLKPGRYRLLATATAEGVVGSTLRRNFRIRR